MSYKITIINNDDGEILVNEESAKAIVGAVAVENGVHCLGHTNCNAVELMATLEGVDTAKNAILKNHPKLQMLLALKGAMDICKSDSEPTNEN